MTEPVLSVRNLRVEFFGRRGKLVAIDDVSFDVAQGEILGVVGESGAGKSVTGAAIVGLIEHPGRMTGGEIRLKGDRIDHLPAAGMRKIRGRRIGMVFQDPLSSLNPLFRIGDQIVETMRAHLEVSKADARRRTVKLLDEVGIPAAASRVDAYPHQLSGGMRQRVVLALVLCTAPELIIADEPTTALDVSVQAQIIALIKALAKNYGTIGHAHHARPWRGRRDRRPRGGDVRGTAGRDRIGARCAQGRQASLQPGLDERHSDPASGRWPFASNPGCDAATARHAEWMRIPPALPVRVRTLPRGTPDAGSFRRYRSGLLAPWQRSRGRSMSANAMVVVEGLWCQFDVSRPWLNRIFNREGRATLTAVADVSFAIPQRKTFALVGESGIGQIHHCQDGRRPYPADAGKHLDCWRINDR